MNRRRCFLWNHAARALFVGGSEAAAAGALLCAGMRPIDDLSSVLWILSAGAIVVLAFYAAYAATEWRWQRALGFRLAARIFCAVPVFGGVAKGIVYWPRADAGTRYKLLLHILMPILFILCAVDRMPFLRVPGYVAAFAIGLIWWGDAAWIDLALALSRRRRHARTGNPRSLLRLIAFRKRGRALAWTAGLVGLPLLLLPPCGVWTAIFILQRQAEAAFETLSASQPRSAADLRQRYPADVTPNAAPLYRRAFAIAPQTPEGNGAGWIAENREYFRLLDEAAKMPLARFGFSYTGMSIDPELAMGFSQAVKHQGKRLETQSRPDWIATAALVRHQADFANILGFLLAKTADARRLEFLQNAAQFDSATLQKILLHLKDQEHFFKQLAIAAYQGERAQLTELLRTADSIPYAQEVCLHDFHRSEVRLALLGPFAELVRWKSLAEYWRITRRLERLLPEDFYLHRAEFSRLYREAEQIPFFALPLMFTLPQLLNPVAQRYYSRLATLRCARGALAAELFRREHGRFPERPAELVPGALPELPVNPFDGTALTFKTEAHTLTVSAPGGTLEKTSMFLLKPEMKP